MRVRSFFAYLFIPSPPLPLFHPTTDGAAAGSTADLGGWDFDIQLNPDFLEGDDADEAYGDAGEADVEVLQGQFDPQNVAIPNKRNSEGGGGAAAARRSAPAATTAASPSKKRQRSNGMPPPSPKTPAPTSSSSSPAVVGSSNPRLVTITDSHGTVVQGTGTVIVPPKLAPAAAKQPTPTPTSSTTMPEWNVHLVRLMSESFDVQTRKHFKFEELDTSTLQRIQGAVHEKFGVGFKDIFIAMRKKSVNDNKKAKCACSDCVFSELEEVSDTW